MEKTLISLEPIKEQIREKLLAQLENTEFTDADKIQLGFSAKQIVEEFMPKDLPEPRVLITAEAYSKMYHLVDTISTECAWHGIVRKQNNVYIITDILMYPQHVTGATVKSVDDEYPMWCMELSDDQINNMRMQGHSHVNFSASPSGEDERYYHEFLSQVDDYYIHLIMNKAQKIWIRFWDIENNIRYEEVPLEIYLTNNTTLDTWYDTQKVQIKEPPKTTLGYGKGINPSYHYDEFGYKGYSGYYQQQFDDVDDKEIKTGTKLKDTALLEVVYEDGSTKKAVTLRQLAKYMCKHYNNIGNQKELIENFKKYRAVTLKEVKQNKWSVYWGQVRADILYPSIIEWEEMKDESK